MASETSKMVEDASSGKLAPVVTALSKVVDPLIKAGSIFAAAMLALLMFLIFVEVAGRGLGGISFVHQHLTFIHAFVGSDELASFLMGMVVAFGLGYCALLKGHIRVDITLTYVPKKALPWFDIFTYLVSFVFYIFITWQFWRNAIDSLQSHVTSNILLLPIYPVMFVMIVGTAFLALVFLRDFLASINEVTR
jgi:TRAP-type C4-dicarboxylate transport system permease small subunit